MSSSCVMSTHRDAALLVQALEDAHHFDARPRVEVAGRLVGQQDRRVVDQRARDRDALLLAARQLVRMVIRPVARGRPASSTVGRALVPLGRLQRVAAVEQRQLDVVERRGPRQQVEPLEHEPDLLVADAPPARPSTSATRPRRRGSTARTSARSRQPTMCMNVDLPEPDGPVTARNSPGSTSRFTPRSAFTSTSPTT